MNQLKALLKSFGFPLDQPFPLSAVIDVEGSRIIAASHNFDKVSVFVAKTNLNWVPFEFSGKFPRLCLVKGGFCTVGTRIQIAYLSSRQNEQLLPFICNSRPTQAAKRYCVCFWVPSSGNIEISVLLSRLTAFLLLLYTIGERKHLFFVCRQAETTI